MPGDGKTSRCGWEVLTSGRRERRDEREADEGAGRRERTLTSGRREDEGGAGKRERGREPGWERRERGRVGVLSWLNLMSGGGQDGSSFGGGSFWTTSALGRSLSRLDYSIGRGESRGGGDYHSPLMMRRRTEELCARWDGLALDIDEILEAPIDSSIHLMPPGGQRMSQPYVQSSAQHGVLPLGESAEPLHLFHTIRNRKHILHCYELLLMRTLEEDPALWQRLCDRFGFCSECEKVGGGGGCPPLQHGLHTATKDSFKVNSISPDLWFLAIALKESKDKLIHFIRSEGPKRKVGLPGKHLASNSFLSSYLSSFNFVELNLDSIFRYGEVSQIPSEIFRCVNVRTLSLRHNFLEALPPDIGRLAKLERLFLTNNKLQNKSIPFTIAFCPALQELYIDNNLLDALPGVLLRLSSLERVHRHGNHNYFKATFMWYHTDINDRILECPGEPEPTRSSPPSLQHLSGLAVIRSRINFFASPLIPNRVKDFICWLCNGIELCSACSAARPTTAPSYKVFTFKNPYLGNTCVPFQHWACSLACAREVEIPARREQLHDRREQDRQYERYVRESVSRLRPSQRALSSSSLGPPIPNPGPSEGSQTSYALPPAPQETVSCGIL